MDAFPIVRSRREWEDFLSPILVKELRQGLREPLFVISFIALQVGLAFLIFIGLGSENDSGAVETQGALFQGALFLMFLFILPLRGLAALSGERRHNTLETMLLTQLSPWGVVFGKWTALVFQGFLLATTVLPYIIIRYMTGGEELIDNLISDAYIFWGFIILSAICVGLSAISIIARICCAICLFVFCFSVNGGLIYSGGSRLGTDPLNLFLWLVLFLIFLPLLIFEFAATSVTSQNGVTGTIRKRLLLLLFLALITLLQIFAQLDILFYIGIGCFITGVFLELCQFPDIRLRNLMPFIKFGPLARLLSLLFLPGWPSGILYGLIVIPLGVCMAMSFYHSGTLEVPDARLGLCWVVAIFGSIFIPLLGIISFFPKLSFRMFLLTIINLISFAIFGVIQTAFTGSTIRPLPVLEFLPSLGTLITSDLLTGSDTDEQIRFIIKGGAVDLVLMGILIVCSVPWLEKFNQAWALAKTEKQRV